MVCVVKLWACLGAGGERWEVCWDAAQAQLGPVLGMRWLKAWAFGIMVTRTGVWPSSAWAHRFSQHLLPPGWAEPWEFLIIIPLSCVPESSFGTHHQKSACQGQPGSKGGGKGTGLVIHFPSYTSPLKSLWTQNSGVTYNSLALF